MKRQTVFRVLLFLGGAALIGWSLCSFRFYNPEGSLLGSFALPFSAGIGFLLLTLFPSRFGFWLATGLFGQAVLLQMIDAGKRLHYQHYRLFESSPYLFVFFALQTGLVAAGLWPHRTVIAGWIRRHALYLSIAGLPIAAISAAVSEDVSFYAAELAFGFVAAVVQIGNLFLIIRRFHEGYFFRSFHRYVTNENGNRIDRFAVMAAIWVTFASLLLSIFVYERHPHVNDEVAYLWQARILSQGSPTIDAPPVPKAFDVYLFDYSNNRMSVVPPPGWPALLALGVWIKAPWVVNPFLAGINILLAYFVLAHLYSRRIARISILLLCFSPWFVFMGMNFMTHQWTTTCTLLCAAGVIQTRRTSRNAWSFLSGIFLGIQSLIRPLDALILGVLIGLWMIGIGGRRLKFSALLAFGAGTLLTGSLIFPYNRYFTGDALTYPINVYNETLFGKNANAYGFGKDHGMGWPLDPLPGHGPVAAMINAQLNGSQIQVELFGWSTGCLWFVFLFFLSRRMQRPDWILFSVLIAVFTGYFFYYFSGGPDFGARYWFMMILPLVALTVRGIDWVQSGINPGGKECFTAILVLSFFAVVNYFPWRATDKYHHYLGMRPEICSILGEDSAGADLVLVRGERFPDYASAMVCNPVDFQQGSPLFVWDRSPEVRRLLEMHYPGRTFHAVRGPSLTGRGYELLLSAETAKRTSDSARLPAR